MQSPMQPWLRHADAWAQDAHAFLWQIPTLHGVMKKVKVQNLDNNLAATHALRFWGWSGFCVFMAVVPQTQYACLWTCPASKGPTGDL